MSNLYLLQHDTVNSAANVDFEAKECFIGNTLLEACQHFGYKEFSYYINYDDEDREDNDKYTNQDIEEQNRRLVEIFTGERTSSSCVYEIPMSDISGYC